MLNDTYENDEREEDEDSGDGLNDDQDESYDASIDSDIMEWCPNCGDIKPHLQVGESGVKVKCVECNFEHIREDDQDNIPEEPTFKEDLSTPESRLAAWKRLTDVDEADILPYSIRIKPNVGDVLKHKLFGIGVVIELSDATRAEVLFEDEIRRLVCGK